RGAMALQNARLFEAQRTTNERLDVALQAGLMGTWEWDIQSNTIAWSTQLERIHGLQPGSFGGTFEAYLSDIHPDDLDRVRATIAESLHAGTHHLEYRIVWPDGSLHWLEASGRVVSDSRGNVIGMRGVCQDITARKMEEAERIQLQERERVASEARAALEERQRLARELHDSVSQALYGIALGSQTALAALQDDGDAGSAENAISYVHRLAEAAITEMRALIFELRPESLEKDGLVAALERQVASLRARHGLDVDAVLPVEPTVSVDKKEALYRIAQEALNNAVKHSHAHAVRLGLRASNGHVVLEVVDDGVGFDPSTPYVGHLGLVSMQERAAAAGGTLSITSEAGRGARVVADVPA
ncbi:MAG: PAS domain-containing protein, partial [Chloroflexi bacterium]|nr:PAS domain-containing protein [Chloroflexota bacterium]